MAVALRFGVHDYVGRLRRVTACCEGYTGRRCSGGRRKRFPNNFTEYEEGSRQGDMRYQNLPSLSNPIKPGTITALSIPRLSCSFRSFCPPPAGSLVQPPRAGLEFLFLSALI
ncbi:hypothetical protein PLICRDRAFT_597074 [Plicaturopsis crispa FD-325 SS-3]|nr:hypothetical protein PLICRDRAFT_597074 [Plicaturopsis crispa FD-325 SS-3]